ATVEHLPEEERAAGSSPAAGTELTARGQHWAKEVSMSLASEQPICWGDSIGLLFRNDGGALYEEIREAHQRGNVVLAVSPGPEAESLKSLLAWVQPPADHVV